MAISDYSQSSGQKREVLENYMFVPGSGNLWECGLFVQVLKRFLLVRIKTNVLSDFKTVSKICKQPYEEFVFQ